MLLIIQYGVVAYALDNPGTAKVLLITSRDTGRWVIPRGNPIPGLTPEQTAVQEAYEEAGVIGTLAGPELGTYTYSKRRRDGSHVDAEVHVFPLKAQRLEERWPEGHERERRWFSPAEAADAVDEPELKRLLTSFAA